MSFHYVIKRISLCFFTLFILSILCFLIIHCLPGGPIEALYSFQEENRGIEVNFLTIEQKKTLIFYYQFDKPILVRYFIWIKNLIFGELGESFYYLKPVKEVIQESFLVSVLLGFSSLIICYCIAIPLGIFIGSKTGDKVRNHVVALLVILESIPSFALGMILIFLFAGERFWNIFPLSGMYSDSFSENIFYYKMLDVLHHLFLPMVCLCSANVAQIAFGIQFLVQEEKKQEYTITAKAKGLSESQVLWKHIFPNLLVPLSSNLGGWFVFAFSGSLMIEILFSLHGIGKLSYDSMVHRDYPVLVPLVVFTGFLHIFGNFFSDLVMQTIDPKVHF